MKRLLVAGAASLAMATSAQAAGVERSTQSTAILFEKGTYAEFSFGFAKPKISGTQLVNAGATSPAGASSGNMTNDFTTLSFGLKTALNDRLSLAVVVDRPIGADVFYAPNSGYLYGGSTAAFGGSSAELKSKAITAMVKYTTPANFSVFGGLRAQETSGNVALFNGYRLNVAKETDLGYLVGVAWEKPEIALRVALTYNSAINHTFSITENGAPSLPLEVEIPQSVNLEFQSGIAANTLVFGSLRYVDWTAFEIAPAGYVAAAGSPLVRYNGDTTTVTLGIARRFNKNWSGLVSFGYEHPVGEFSGNLGPTDGQKSIGLGVVYEKDRLKITGGIRYVDLGGVRTEAPRPFPPGTPFASFEKNHAVAVGLKVGISF